MLSETNAGTNNAVSGTHRAAQLLMVLGEDNAAQILRQLGQSEVEKLGAVMSEMSEVSNNNVGSVLQHFVTQYETDNTIRLQADDYTRKVMITALGENQAMGVLGKISRGAETSALEDLSRLKPGLIAGILQEEHPQTKTIIISYLSPHKASEVLAQLPEEAAMDILLRMASMGSVDPKALTELNNALSEQISGVVTKQSSAIEGVKTVANILNAMDRKTEGSVMDQINKADSALGQRIQDMMYVFEDLENIPDRDFQVVLREISTDKLSVALKGAEESLKEKIYGNMSARAVETFKEDMKLMGPVKINEVEQAQKEILDIIKRLSDNGDITLSNNTDGMVD